MKLGSCCRPPFVDSRSRDSDDAETACPKLQEAGGRELSNVSNRSSQAFSFALESNCVDPSQGPPEDFQRPGGDRMRAFHRAPFNVLRKLVEKDVRQAIICLTCFFARRKAWGRVGR